MREVRCVRNSQRFGADKETRVPEALCLLPEPSLTQSCNSHSCTGHWSMGDWSQVGLYLEKHYHSMHFYVAQLFSLRQGWATCGLLGSYVCCLSESTFFRTNPLFLLKYLCSPLLYLYIYTPNRQE